MIEKFEVFTIAMSEITSFWARIATSEMERYGLKGVCAKYFITLLKNPDGITAARICDVCYRDKAEVSRTIAALEKKGLVVRENVGANSYRALIKLTAEGKKAAKEIAKRVEYAYELGGEGIDEKDRELFHSCLEIIVKNLKEHSDKK